MTVSFPHIGREYAEVFKSLLEDMGMEVMPPAPITDEAIAYGVRHSSDMMCYPFKCALGSLWQVVTKNVDIILMWDSQGQCRLRHWWKIQDHILKNQNYNGYKIIPIRPTLIPAFKKANPKLSTFKAVRVICKHWKHIRKIDKRKQQWVDGGINIGLVGEVYTCVEEAINYDIEKKLKRLDANPYFTVTLSDYLIEALEYLFHFSFVKRKWKRMARKYLNGPLGGHGFESIYNSLWLRDKGVDGIIHLLPLSCMPETTIEPIMNTICQEADLPLLRLPIDETNSEANFETRIEAFIELIKRKRHG